MSPVISVKLADDELEQLAQGGPAFGPKLAKLLDEEVNNFDEWMQRELGGQIIPIERTILKTYLYHKIVGRVDSLERKPLSEISVASTI
jgi:hypothetical protein